MKKRLKFLALVMSIVSIYTITATPIQVSAATIKAPSTPKVCSVYSRVKGQFTFVFDTILKKQDSYTYRGWFGEYEFEKYKKCDGYQLAYSTDSKCKKNLKYKSADWVKANRFVYSYIVVRDLTPGKVYYAKVRAYKLNGKKKVYSKWSEIKKVKISKKTDPEVYLLYKETADGKADKSLKHSVPCEECGKPKGSGYNGTCFYIKNFDLEDQYFNQRYYDRGMTGECNNLGERNIKKVKLTKVKNLKKYNKFRGFTLWWDNVDYADGYYVQYSTSPTFKKKYTKSVCTDGPFLSMDWLKPNKKYYIRVKAYIRTAPPKFHNDFPILEKVTNDAPPDRCPKRYGSYSKVVTATTKVGCPESIKTTTTNNSVAFKIKRKYCGKLDRYRIEYSTDKSFKNAKTAYFWEYSKKKVIKNLKPDTTYYFKVRGEIVIMRTVDSIKKPNGDVEMVTKVVGYESKSSYTKPLSFKTKKK